MTQVEHDPMGLVIFWVSFIFASALLGRTVAKRFNQPGVLGELLAGVIVGNLSYFLGVKLFVVLRESATVFNILGAVLDGTSLKTAVHAAIPNDFYANQLFEILKTPSGMGYIKIAYILDIFSRYGVIFLLFMVGLESSFQDLKRTGREATQVALIGVIAPIIFGFVVAYYLLPTANFQTALFVAATLSATSIGITARVLTDLKKLHTREAKTILGAAMLDDVLGLIILAIVSGVVLTGSFEAGLVIRIMISSLLFFVVALTLGPWILRKAVRCFHSFELWESKLFVSLMFMMMLSWIATWVYLASIIGAFAAGLIIHDGFFAEGDTQKKPFDIKELVAPLEAMLAPIFFVLIGVQVKLETFISWPVIWMAFALTLAAIVGKLMSGLGANRQDDRLLIGCGMIPRGEVGLVFASIGRTLDVLSDELFAAIILMIIITTFIAPILLKQRYQTRKRINS